MSKKTTITIVILITLLVITLGYIGYLEYSKLEIKKQLSVYQQGAREGYEQAIIQVMQQASTCQEVPLYVGNQTISIKAVGCS